jgi:hypothetical protein
MGIQSIGTHAENQELITNYDLVSSAHAILDGIDLDVASSRVANTYVEAREYFTPSDDGLNLQQWYGSVYLFPPSGAYFWDKKKQRWKMTRTSSPTLISSHAVWFRRLYKEWLAGNIKHAVYFSNCPDMIRYDQRIFDFPICILRTAPCLIRNSNKGIDNHKTCTSFVLYMPPQDSSADAVEKFVEIYSEKGRVLH